MSFAAAIAAAQRVARQATSEGEITYTRAGDEVALSAGRGQSRFDELQGDVLVRVESRDFLIATAELKLAGEVTLPTRGDTITETDAAGTTYTYEVLEFGNEPCWRYADDYRLQIRVHTKLTATVPA